MKITKEILEECRSALDMSFIAGVTVLESYGWVHQMQEKFDAVEYVEFLEEQYKLQNQGWTLCTDRWPEVQDDLIHGQWKVSRTVAVALKGQGSKLFLGYLIQHNKNHTNWHVEGCTNSNVIAWYDIPLFIDKGD